MYSGDDLTFAVCAYGESPYLDECVRSVLEQERPAQAFIATSTPCEHISTIARRYGLRVIENGHVPGIAVDWNSALAAAQTRFVTIAHQDDVYLPAYSKRLLEAANRADDLLVFFTNYGELRDGARVDVNRLLKVKRAMLAPLKDGRFRNSRFVRRRILAFGTPVCCPSACFNTALVPPAPFSTRMHCSLDWDAWERLSRLAGAFHYDSHLLMLHRIHADSETTRLIGNSVRSVEDREMFERFWPVPVANTLARLYAKSLDSNVTEA